MPKVNHLDTDKFNEALDKSGLKITYIAKSLGLTYQGFRMKRIGKIPFRKLEVDALVSILGLSEEAKSEIFLD